MDYKVKYEQAIADARAIIKDYKERHLDDIAKRSEEDFSAVFPELKESEDERIRQRIIHALHGDVLEISEIKEAIAWIKKQGEQKQELLTKEKVLKNSPFVEQKPAWSEEDERIYQSIMDDTVQENQLDGKQTDWLRDIKYRHFSQPQNTWKPSEEQIEALDFAANCIVPAEFCLKRKVLKELLEQLKKLREE